MFTSTRWLTGFMALALAAGTCLGEDAPPAKSYKLDFLVKEVDGTKVLNARTYSTLLSTGGGRSQIRAGSKVRFGNQMLDVGTDIDVSNAKDVDNRLAFYVNAAITSVPAGSSDSSGPTIIRDNRWGSFTIVSLKKPTILFSSDNVDGKGQMQVEVTATLVP